MKTIKGPDGKKYISVDDLCERINLRKGEVEYALDTEQLKIDPYWLGCLDAYDNILQRDLDQ